MLKWFRCINFQAFILIVRRITVNTRSSKMKCTKTMFALILICRQTISFFTVDSSIIRLIQYREILENGKIVSIKNILNNDTINDTNTALLISNYSNTVYTTLKCKYADVIVDLLQTFFEFYEYGRKVLKIDNTPHVINLLASVTENFYNIKSPIAKIIDNLFSYFDEYPELRTSDPSLLMSLLTIQFFLYNRKKDPLIIYNNDIMPPKMKKDDINKTLENLKIRNASIVQMIGLVEKFRHKRCVVYNPYKKTEEIRQQCMSNEMINEKIFKKILNPTLDLINSLINNGSDNYKNINNEIYDPENLFFENIITERFEYIKNIKVLWDNKELDLQSVYEIVRCNYNIKNVLKFQSIVVNLIADIFNQQICNLLTFLPNDIKIRLVLLNTVQLFIDQINQNNILMNVSNILIVPVLSLKEAFRKYDKSNNLNILKPIIKLFELGIHTNSLFKKIQNIFEDNESLVMLPLYIILDKQFIQFCQIFNLLSYHLHTESIIHIIEEFNYLDNDNDQNDEDKIFINDINNFQYCLFTFRISLEKETFHKTHTDATDNCSIKLTIPALSSSSSSKGNLDVEYPEMVRDIHCSELDGYGRNFGYIITIVVKLLNVMDDYPYIRNILIPLLIRFRYTDEYLCQTNKYELVALHQNIFLAITLIENYVIKMYTLSLYKYSSEIFTEYFTNDTQEFDVNLLKSVENTNFRETLVFIIRLYNENMPSSFFLENDKQIKMDWNGSKQFGYEVLRNISTMVIDSGDIINFQLFAAKWLLANILVKMFNALMIVNDEIRQGHPGVINKININIKLNELDEISDLKLPTSIRVLLANTIDVARTTLSIKSMDFSTKNMKHCRQLFNDNLKFLGVHPNDLTFNRYNTIDEIIKTVSTDFKNLNDILKVISTGPLESFFSNNLDSLSNADDTSDNVLNNTTTE